VSASFKPNGAACFKNVNNCLNTNIYSYLETSNGQSSDLYLKVVRFFNAVLIIHLWQHKTAVFLNCGLIPSSLSTSPKLIIAVSGRMDNNVSTIR